MERKERDFAMSKVRWNWREAHLCPGVRFPGALLSSSFSFLFSWFLFPLPLFSFASFYAQICAVQPNMCVDLFLHFRTLIPTPISSRK